MVTVHHAIRHLAPSPALYRCSNLWPNADDKPRTAGTALMDSVILLRTLCRLERVLPCNLAETNGSS